MDDPVEIGAKAIFDAENGIDGDRIGTMIHENFRIDPNDGNKGIDNTLEVCRVAARAVIAALEGAGYAIMNREPTTEMIRQMNLSGFNASIRKVSTDVFHAAHDAAPRYGG